MFVVKVLFFIWDFIVIIIEFIFVGIFVYIIIELSIFIKLLLGFSCYVINYFFFFKVVDLLYFI